MPAISACPHPALAGGHVPIGTCRCVVDTLSLWMRNTPMPLSIAYLDALGRVVFTADMEPCGDRADCPGHPPPRSYRYAVEVPRGRLAGFGLVAGATLHVDGITS